jgi:hypothetical protein
MNIQHVPVDFVNQVWSQVEAYINSAIEQQKGECDYTLDQVRTLVVTGQWLLIVASNEDNEIKGAATISFTNRPNHRVAFITYIGGRLVTNPGTFQQMCVILKRYGATCIEGAVNETIARLWRRYGFKDKYSVVGVTIP